MEKWIEDPEASLEPYAAMRRAYPSGQSHAANKNEVSSDRLVVCVMSGMLSEAVVFFTSTTTLLLCVAPLVFSFLFFLHGTRHTIAN